MGRDKPVAKAASVQSHTTGRKRKAAESAPVAKPAAKGKSGEQKPVKRAKKAATEAEAQRAEGVAAKQLVAAELAAVDDTGAPAHRASARLHRAQAMPHTEVTAPRQGVAAHTERLTNFTIPASKAALALLSGTAPATTPPILSKFERALVVGHRARELALGAATAAPFKTWAPAKIAELELDMQLLDDYALRRTTHGDSSRTNAENWIIGDFHIV